MDSRRLDRSLFHGLAWTGLLKWVSQALSWAVMIYVARLLTPADFGTVAMASVAIGLARMVDDLGLDAAIVQDRTLTPEQMSRLGGLALALGCALCLIFVALSLPIATFFHERAVTWIICVLSINFITDALQVVPRALLQRDLAFRRLAWVQGLQVLSSTVCTAALGFGYWALVLNSVVSGVGVTLLLYMWRPHPLAWPRRLRSVGRAVTFGWHLLLSRIAWYAYSNVDSALVGRLLGKVALGSYSLGMTFATIPVTEVSSLVGRVVPGVFSTVQGDRAGLKRYFLMLTEGISYLTLPATLGLALTADTFVPLVLGPQWVSAIPTLRFLALYTAMLSVTTLLSHVLLWTGHSKWNMLLNVLALVVLTPLFYVASRWGAAGVAASWTVGFPLVTLPAFFAVFKILGIGPVPYLRALGPAFLASVAMAAAVEAARAAVPAHAAIGVRFAAHVGSGAAVYVATIALAYRSRVRAITDAVRGRPGAALADAPEAA